MSNILLCKNPLVSLVVIAYNSSKYIIETLESIKKQTYENIELIIADDRSTDNTSEIVNSWLAKNSNRFIRSTLLVNAKNLGVAPNCNAGLAHAKGEWVKLIAGDDLLEARAISSYIEYLGRHPDARAVLANLRLFGEKFGNITIDPNFGALSARDQLRYLLTNSRPAFGPSGIVHRDTLLRLGGFDERVPMLEDLPMSLRFLSNGVKIYLLEDYLVRYRIRNTSLSSGIDFGEKYWEMVDAIFFPEIRRQKLFLLLWSKKIDYFLWRWRNSPFIKIKAFRMAIKSFDVLAWKLFFLKKAKSRISKNIG